MPRSEPADTVGGKIGLLFHLQRMDEQEALLVVSLRSSLVSETSAAPVQQSLESEPKGAIRLPGDDDQSVTSSAPCLRYIGAWYLWPRKIPATAAQ